jgi:hypothetical protein
LHVPGQQRGSRRTRDGRTPFVRQQQLSAWFDRNRSDGVSFIAVNGKYW